MNRTKEIIPHCHVCREEFKAGVEVVFDGILKGIIHEACNNLPQKDIGDHGRIEEVVLRNQTWLRQFNHMVLH
jgi:hypothetical protein